MTAALDPAPPATIQEVWWKSPIRKTMFEILQFCNTKFRMSYASVAKDAVRIAREEGIQTIVELGAGTAPLTREIAADPEARGLRLVPCDLVPDVAAYEAIAQRYPGQVEPKTVPVDYGQLHDWGPSAMLLLMGTFPAIDAKDRSRVLENLTRSSQRVMVIEPLRKSVFSVISACLSVFLGLMLPLYLWGSPGTLRRIVWCWLCPLATLLFAADGVRWCFRCLSEAEWRTALSRTAGENRSPAIRNAPNWQEVTW